MNNKVKNAIFSMIRSLLLTLSLLAAPVLAQTAMELKQKSMAQWGVGTAQYSGITALGGNRYAMVSDKEPSDGFFAFRIDQNAATGEVTNVYLEGFHGNPSPKVDATGISIRDCEGVAYFPPSHTIFISGEGDQAILEYALDGKPTGRSLAVPAQFGLDKIVANYGFEALSYDTINHRFWTITESTLKADGHAASAQYPAAQNVLRLQSFTDDLQPGAQYAYRMDRGRSEKFGNIYVYGVPEVTTLPDGRLLVLEREANIPSGYIGSECRCKLFLVDPSQGYRIDSSTDLRTLDPNKFLVKKLLLDFRTLMNLTKHNFANYEGMCLGRKLADGRQTLLLVCDSQGGYGKGPVHLKDYIKVVVLGN